ncbi:cytochrome P450 [Trametes maxima]|nr:cytochrome P450 [Trametes maxima]
MSGNHPWVFIGIALTFLAIRELSRRRRRLPPGPKGVPLLGNAHQVPPSFQEKAYFNWGKQYGDVVYLQLFQTPTIILNSVEAARDLLDKRSAKYSDRPRMVLLDEMLGGGASVFAMRYIDPRFRRHRRWLQEGVGTRSKLNEYQYIQQREMMKLMRNLLERPGEFTDHFHLYLAAELLEITYGRRVDSLDDELVRVAERGLDTVVDAGRPGSVPVDFFPFLKYVPSWFPGAEFQRNAKIVRGYLQAWKDTGYDLVVSSLAIGSVIPCISTSVLTEFGGPPTPAQAEDVKGLAVAVYGAGVETSRGTLAVFLLAMARNREVLLKAQEEMDRVIGHDRLPEFNDRDSLPYLNAILEEVYRWNPSLPTALPHCLLEDDEYRGYDLPAGCMVLANTWAMTRDTRHYPEPEEFRPERYLEDKTRKEGVLLPSSFVFGYGRRVCPGQPLADASIWLAMANIIALFDIRKAVDASGREITPPAEFLSKFSSMPAPFSCRILPRSEKRVRLLALLDV